MRNVISKQPSLIWRSKAGSDMLLLRMARKNKLPTLDLHGKRVDEVFDLVDAFLTKHQSKSRVCIMPGKGTGALKTELTRYLKLGNHPWDYETLPNGQKNTGSLIVFMA